MSSASIIVCEDESIVAKDIENRLKKMGYTVAAVVASGEEALKKTAEFYPDLVLMDIRIKGSMDGIEAAREIQSFFEIPVIYLTAYADENTLERAKITEPYGYILKPFKEKELHASIEIALSKQRMEKRLKEREQWLTTVLRSIADGVIATDLNGFITFMNPVAEALTGWKQEEALGKQAAEILAIATVDPRTFIENPLSNAFKDCIVVEQENPTIIIPRDGPEIPIKYSVAPVKDDKGNIAGAVLVCRDISLAKQAEKALRESEARVRRLVESNIIGIIIADFSGNIIEANDAFLEIGGYTRDDFLMGKVRWSDMTPAEYADRDRHAIEQTKASGVCTPFEKEFIRPDGSCISVLVGIALLEGSDDRFVAFVLDITERKRLEQVLRHQAEELSQANRMKDEFLAIVSHELRTPLTAMLGWAGLLRNRKLNEATITRALESIERNAKTQVKIIDDILDVSRIIRGKLSLNNHLVELVSAIEAVVEDLRPMAEAKGIQLESQFDGSVGQILGDLERLQQIIWNLLSNAIKFTPFGGRVRIRLYNTLKYAQIQVSDTGVGIKPEFLPYVFDRFRQADSTTTRIHGGLGLGLAIVRHLVELHGGTVRAISEGEGKGATFIVELPLIEGENHKTGAMKVRHSPASPIAPAPSMLLSGLRVLVVDDDADTCELIVFVLESYGAQVTGVMSAIEALEAIARSQPDVLISDIGMPQEDGYWLIAKLKEGGKLLPALALTAFSREEDRQHALSAGFKSHLPKPIEPEDLVAAIANLAHPPGE